MSRFVRLLRPGGDAGIGLAGTTGRAMQAMMGMQKLDVAKLQAALDGVSLGVVLHVLYLVFNEGYAASAGEAHQRVDLSSEAIRLARGARPPPP